MLSIEESGKLGFLAATGNAPKVPGRLKHGMHASLFLALVEAFSPSNMAKDWRPILHEGNTSNLTAKQEQIIAGHPEVAEFVRQVQAGELPDSKLRVEAWAAAMVAMQQREGTLKPQMDRFVAGLQPLRLKATYVDISESGNVLSEPDVGNIKLAEMLCAGAAGLIVFMLALAAKQHPAFDSHSIAEPIVEDLTGVEVLGKAFPIISRIKAARPGAIHRLARRVEAAQRR